MQAYQLGQRFTTAGAPLNGGKAYFYLTGTLTLEDVFEDDGLVTPLANPVIADSSGHFPELVYLDPTKTYRMILKTSADVTISDADPINTAQSGGGVDGATINADSIPGTALEPTAIEDRLGFTPQESFAALTDHEINVLLRRVGIVEPYFGTATIAGALLCNGGTIGSALSGASSLASADAAELFALLWAWAAADSPILDSAGAGATRGANAAADFAANKRLTLPDLRGEFIRGLDLSRGIDAARAIGSYQADTLKAHAHTYYSVRTDIANGGQSVVGATGSGSTTGSTGDTETKPRNVALTYIVRY